MPRRVNAGVCGLVLMVATRAASADPSELPPAFNYNYGEIETPRSAGMSGALRALSTGSAAMFLNPASMSRAHLYHIDALGQFTPEGARQVYGGAIVDSTRRMAGGVSVVGAFLDPDGIDRSYIDVRIGLSFAVSDRFSLGVAGRYLNLDQEGFGPLGDSRASGGLTNPEEPGDRSSLVQTLTLDAGLSIGITEGLVLSASGQNLTYPNNGILPTVVGGGLGYGTNDFSVEVDGVADLTSWGSPTPRVMAGAEYLIADRVPVRAGYRYDGLDLGDAGYDQASHSLSAGVGYVDPRFGVQASVRRTLVGPSATIIVVGLSYHLESSGLVSASPEPDAPPIYSEASADPTRMFW